MEQQNFNPPSSAQQPSPKGIKPFWLIVLLVLVVVLVGVLLWQKNNASQAVDTLQQQISALQNQVSDKKIIATTSNEIAGWKTYRNEKYGFALKHPLSLKVDLFGKSDYNSDIFYIWKGKNQPSDFTARIYIDKNISTDLQQYLKQGDEFSQTAYEGTPSKEILSSKNIVVDNLPAIQRREEWFAAGFEALVTYVKSGSDIYHIEVIDLGVGSDNKIEIYNKMLSTFKFSK